MKPFPIPENPTPIEMVPLMADLPTLREEIAAAYERSAWARLACLLVFMLVAQVGVWTIVLSVPALAGPLAVLWILAVSAFGAWYLVPPRKF